jgi:hypothetical protein
MVLNYAHLAKAVSDSPAFSFAENWLNKYPRAKTHFQVMKQSKGGHTINHRSERGI